MPELGPEKPKNRASLQNPGKRYFYDNELREYREVYEVYAPGWRDFIRTRGLYGPDPAERVEQKRRLVRKIIHSPTPYIAKSVQNIMTTCDNIQDAAVTLSVATRIAAIFYPAVRAVALPIARAADILNAVCSLSLMGLPGRRAKGLLEKAVRRSRWGYTNRLKNSLRTGRVNFTFGEAIQIAQTSAGLFDVGVNLGGGMGYVVDTAFGLIRGADFIVDKPSDILPLDPLAQSLMLPTFGGARTSKFIERSMSPDMEEQRIRIKGLVPAFRDVFKAHGVTEDLAYGEVMLALMDASTEVAKGYQVLAPLRDELEPEQHLSILVLFEQAMYWLKWFARMIDYPPVMNTLLDYSIKGGTPWDPQTRTVLLEEGVDPDALSRVTMEGAPVNAPYRDYMTWLSKVIDEAMESWEKDLPVDVREGYIPQLVKLIADSTYEMAEAGTAEEDFHYTPEVRAGLTLLDYGLGHLVVDEPGLFLPGFEDVVEKVRAAGGSVPPYSEFVATLTGSPQVLPGQLAESPDQNFV